MMTTNFRVLVALLFAVLPLLLSAQPTTLLKPPTSGDGATGDYFGVHLYADSDWLFASAYADVLVSTQSAVGAESGSVKVYRVTAGGIATLSQMLTPTQPQDSALFGAAVVRDGDWLAISSPRHSNNRGLEAGSVYLYRLSGSQWQFQSQLQPPVNGDYARFGESLWLGEGVLWVGAPGLNQGEVHLFQLGTGVPSLLQRVPAPAGESRFGHALGALPGNQMAIGAPGSAGVLLVSRSQPAQPLSRLSGPASFGRTVATSSTALVVAAPDDGAGSVFRWVLIDGQWVRQAELRPTQGQPGDGFGAALSVVGAQLYIGAPGTNRDGVLDTGAVYLAGIEGGNPQASSRTLPEFAAIQAGFGTALAASAVHNTIWVGAPLQPTERQRSGTVYAYRLAALGSAAGQPSEQYDRGDGAQLFRFGQAVAVTDGFAAVGAFLADTRVGPDAGYVQMFRKTPSGTWVHDAELAPRDAAIDQRFGIAVDLDGTTAVIGAYWTTVADRPEQGAVYVYERSNGSWVLQTQLRAPDGRTRDLFGASVAIEGDHIAVTADAGGAGDNGAVYLFERVDGQWLQRERLESPLASVFAFFGVGLDLKGDRLAVGAPGVDVGADEDQGAVFLYQRTGQRWQLVQTIHSPVEQSGALFGYDVAMSSSRLLVGVPGLDRSESDPFIGGLWLYRDCRPACASHEQLVVDGLQPGDFLGISVALNERHAVGGASGVDGPEGNASGAVFVHDLVKPGGAQVVAAPAGSLLASFGRALDLDGQGTLIVGSPNRAGDNPAEGGAHLLTIDTDLLADGFED